MVRRESCPSKIGPINLGTKQTGAPSAGNPHAGCDVAGAGNGFTVWLLRHSQRKRGATARLNLRNTAPVLDPTGISSGNQTLTRCAFLDTNPTGELMTSGLPVTRTESHTATDDPVRWPDGLNGLSTPRREPPSEISARRVAMAGGRRRDTLLPSRRRQRRGPQR